MHRSKPKNMPLLNDPLTFSYTLLHAYITSTHMCSSEYSAPQLSLPPFYLHLQHGNLERSCWDGLDGMTRMTFCEERRRMDKQGIRWPSQ